MVLTDIFEHNESIVQIQRIEQLMEMKQSSYFEIVKPTVTISQKQYFAFDIKVEWKEQIQRIMDSHGVCSGYSCTINKYMHPQSFNMTCLETYKARAVGS